VRRELKRQTSLAEIAALQAAGKLLIRELTNEDVRRLDAAKARRRSSPVIQGVAP
jgi:hypothetical protein